MCSGATARNVGLHFDLMCNDDLVDIDHRKHKTIRDDAKNRYAAARCYLDTLTGKEVNSGTPYHIHDLWNQLHQQKDGEGQPLYQHLIIGGGGKGTGNPLSFPTRHDQRFLDRKRLEYESKGMGPLYYLQYQCEPRSEELIAADEEWIRYVPLEEVPPGLSTMIVVDPAWKGTKNAGTGCDAAIACLGFQRQEYLVYTYLMDLEVSNTLTAYDGMNIIFDMMQMWGTIHVAPEEHNTHAFRTELQREGVSRGRPVDIVELKTKFSGKEDRIVAFLKRVQQGTFFIVKECRNQEIFVNQYRDYPQVDKNDALDAIAYCADPNIAERFAPRWNSEANKPFWMREHDRPSAGYRTRHCTL
jgi:hypothetical protein